MKRVAILAQVVVEEYDAGGNLLQASQPQQIQVAVLAPDALRGALGALAEQLVAAHWPGVDAPRGLIGAPDCDDGSGRRGGSVKGGGHTDGG